MSANSNVFPFLQIISCFLSSCFSLLDDDNEGEDVLSPNLDQLMVNHMKSNDGRGINLMSRGSGCVGNGREWKKPSFTVTDFDMDDDDYAADSDDCSV
jgi:hypothetical protein